uniref:Uncharacterized protein n=1 Tax=Oryza nivara TaxID=4536 RepID=A0A0E0HWQ1_ORYNI
MEIARANRRNQAEYATDSPTVTCGEWTSVCSQYPDILAKANFGGRASLVFSKSKSECEQEGGFAAAGGAKKESQPAHHDPVLAKLIHNRHEELEGRGNW